jgi:hypothetical protein
MRLEARRSPLVFLAVAGARQVVRRPFLSLSVAVHAVLLGSLYEFGNHARELREQRTNEIEVASSLRATHVASTAKRLQDLQTIQQLLEKSAPGVAAPAPHGPEHAPPPRTPRDMAQRARELSQAIDALDKKVESKELAELVGTRKAPPSPEKPAQVAQAASAADLARPEHRGASTPDNITAEMADNEIAALEARARATLAKHQRRLEAKANGIPVGAQAPGTGAGMGAASGSLPAPPVRGRDADAAVLAEIADFMRTSAGVDSTVSSRNYRDSGFFDRGGGGAPPAPAPGMVLGSGRMLGQGGEYANRVYLNSWYIIGPFPGRHGAGLFDNPSYPPEKAVLLDAVYYGKDKRLLRWRYVTSQSYPLVPPDMVEDSVYYGYTEVRVDQARDLTAWIGADDDVQIYLNDRLVWKGGNVGKQSYFDAIFDSSSTYLRDYNRTEGKRVLHFNKGSNTIFFKLSNGPNSAFLSMVLTP